MRIFVKSLLSKLHLLSGLQMLRYGMMREICRVRYVFALHRIRRKAKRGEKIKVIFLSTNISKWKCQSVYDRMSQSDAFDPIVALTLTSFDRRESIEVQAKKMCDARAFYHARGCRTVDAYDLDKRRAIALSDFGADIVFPQEPIPMAKVQRIFAISRTALCCYIPYSIEYEDDDAVDCKAMNALHFQPWFHDLLYLNITWNAAQADYGRRMSPWWHRAGKIEGLGHPYFDALQTAEPRGAKDCIIYAPHFSFPTNKVDRPITCSMFLETGMEILAYAQAHREMKWLFKPHPALYSQLIEYGGWSRAKVDAYFGAWEQLGEKCYDGDYVHYFRNSRAMITDCCSFVIEYPVTEKPLIRLVRPDSKVKVRPSVERYIHTLYEADNLEEMQRLFEMVLERREDPRRAERIDALKDLRVLGHDAATDIVEYLQWRVFGEEGRS